MRTAFGRVEPVNNVVVFGDVIGSGADVAVVGSCGERRLSQEELLPGPAAPN